MELTQEQKFYAEIIQKAWDDAEFKKELLTNPAAAIEKLTGKKVNLPEGKRIVVRDQTDDSTVFINIPAKRTTDEVELTEDQLEAVAGGTLLGDIISWPGDIWPPFPFPGPGPSKPGDLL